MGAEAEVRAGRALILVVHYDMDRSTAASRQVFIERVRVAISGI